MQNGTPTHLSPNLGRGKRWRRTPGTKRAQDLNDLKHEFTLYDVWREKHPKKKAFMWHCRYDKIFSQIGYICPQPRLRKLRAHVFNPSLGQITICVSFHLPCEVTRGRGTWELNLAHLEDEEFKQCINEIWLEWQKETINFHDIGLGWDIGKAYIKRRYIDFSIKKAKSLASVQNNLTNDIQNECESTVPDKESNKLLIS